MKSFFKVALMTATLFSISSFVSCEKDELRSEDPKGFVPSHLEVKLPIQLGTGYSWQLTNKSTAAADSASIRIVAADQNAQNVGGKGFEIWTFMTKETGEDVLKFRYLRDWDESTVLKDTVVTFQKVIL